MRESRFQVDFMTYSNRFQNPYRIIRSTARLSRETRLNSNDLSVKDRERKSRSTIPSSRNRFIRLYDYLIFVFVVYIKY